MTEMTVKDHEEAVAEAQKKLDAAKAAASHKEFPKFVEPHASHIVTQKPVHGDAPPHLSTPHFVEHHVDRFGKVSVLVHDAEEEAKALAEAAKEVTKEAE